MIETLKRVKNPMSMDVYFWTYSILEGHITEFVVVTITSYSEGDQKKFKDHVVDIYHL